MVSSPISTSVAVRVLVACALALSVAACGSQPSHDDLKSVLDSYPVPASFQQVSEREYTFGDGPFGAEANAVARYFDPGELADPPRGNRRRGNRGRRSDPGCERR